MPRIGLSVSAAAVLWAAASQAAPVVNAGSLTTFGSGDDPAIQLSGAFAYALDFNAPADRTIDGVTFRAVNASTSVPGVTFTQPVNYGVPANTFPFLTGEPTRADLLSEMLRDHVFSGSPPGPGPVTGGPLGVSLAVTPGRRYSLQLFIADTFVGTPVGNRTVGDRVFDIRVNGDPVVQDLDVYELTGGFPSGTGPTQAVLYTLNFTAAGSSLDLLLTPQATAIPRALMAGLTLRDDGFAPIPEPSAAGLLLLAAGAVLPAAAHLRRRRR